MIMLKKIFVFMIAAMCCLGAGAQTTQPRLFSLEDINFGGVNYHKFRAREPVDDMVGR